MFALFIARVDDIVCDIVCCIVFAIIRIQCFWNKVADAGVSDADDVLHEFVDVVGLPVVGFHEECAVGDVFHLGEALEEDGVGGRGEDFVFKLSDRLDCAGDVEDGDFGVIAVFPEFGRVGAGVVGEEGVEDEKGTRFLREALGRCGIGKSE